MSLNATGQSLYRQLAAQIRTAIRDGSLSAGSRLPSELDLMEQYEVSRNTVRLALGLLREEGLVVTGQGRGSFVAESVPTEPDSGESLVEDPVLAELHAIREELRQVRDRLDELASHDAPGAAPE